MTTPEPSNEGSRPSLGSVALSGVSIAAAAGVITALWESDLPIAAKVAATIFLAGALVGGEYFRQASVVRAERDRADNRARAEREVELRRAVALKEASTNAARVVSRFREIFTEADGDLTRQRQEAIKACLANFCDVFKAELPLVTKPMDAAHFTATVFEFDPTRGRRFLVRKYWHYPGTMPRTEEIDLERHHGSAAGKCVQEGVIVVMEDASRGNFEELRTGQQAEYTNNSMFCAPIWMPPTDFDENDAGAQASATVRPIRGVLTVVAVDCPGFFRDASSDRAFLAQVSEPFSELIRLAYLLWRNVNPPEGGR